MNLWQTDCVAAEDMEPSQEMDTDTGSSRSSSTRKRMEPDPSQETKVTPNSVELVEPMSVKFDEEKKQMYGEFTISSTKNRFTVCNLMRGYFDDIVSDKDVNGPDTHLLATIMQDGTLVFAHIETSVSSTFHGLVCHVEEGNVPQETRRRLQQASFHYQRTSQVHRGGATDECVEARKRQTFLQAKLHGASRPERAWGGDCSCNVEAILGLWVTPKQLKQIVTTSTVLNVDVRQCLIHPFVGNDPDLRANCMGTVRKCEVDHHVVGEDHDLRLHDERRHSFLHSFCGRSRQAFVQHAHTQRVRSSIPEEKGEVSDRERRCKKIRFVHARIFHRHQTVRPSEPSERGRSLDVEQRVRRTHGKKLGNRRRALRRRAGVQDGERLFGKKETRHEQHRPEKS